MIVTHHRLRETVTDDLGLRTDETPIALYERRPSLPVHLEDALAVIGSSRRAERVRHDRRR